MGTLKGRFVSGANLNQNYSGNQRSAFQTNLKNLRAHMVHRAAANPDATDDDRSPGVKVQMLWQGVGGRRGGMCSIPLGQNGPELVPALFGTLGTCVCHSPAVPALEGQGQAIPVGIQCRLWSSTGELLV